MTVRFELTTVIRAPVQTVFEASLDIDAHLGSMEASGEQAIAGVTSGKIGLGETVTWRARHFGINWTMTSIISEMDEPRRFVDEQQRGPFRRFRHVHEFEPIDDGTSMRDQIEFDAPLWWLGDVVERAVLGRYLPKLILERNRFLKRRLES